MLFRKKGSNPLILFLSFMLILVVAFALGRCGNDLAPEGVTPSPTVGASHASPGSSNSAVHSPTPAAGAQVTPTKPVSVPPSPSPTQPTREPTRNPNRSPRPTATPPKEKNRTRYYVVVAGDTLWGISRKFGITVDDLARANGLSVNATLQVGQRLIIPSMDEDSDFELPPITNRLDAPKQANLRSIAPDLVEYLTSRQGVSAAAVYLPETDTIYTWNTNIKFQMASTVKVPIMVTQLSQQYRRDPSASSPGTDLLVPMITVSDNDAATALLNAVGGPAAVERELNRRGITHTDINPNAWGLSTTTAPDMVMLLRSLYYGQYLNEPLRGVAIRLMASIVQDQRWGVPQGLPAGTPIAFKGGWLPLDDGWLVHQIGITEVKGKTVIFAFYNSKQPTWDYGKDTLRNSAMILSREDLP